MNISLENLPMYKAKKRYRRTVAKRAPRGVSIEKRPIEIAERSSFGNWEMDCICGKGRAVWLVLSERLTRKEIIMDNAIAASRGIGKSVVPMIGVIAGSCVFRILWIMTIFAYFHTIESLYLLYACSWTLTAIFENWYFWRCYKRMDLSAAAMA